MPAVVETIQCLQTPAPFKAEAPQPIRITTRACHEAWGLFIGALGCALLADLLFGWGFSWGGAARDIPPVPAAEPVPISRLTVAPLVKRISPAVVNIAVAYPSPMRKIPCFAIPIFAVISGSRTWRSSRACPPARGSSSMPHAGWF
jgi:S1-C subfamily serine protease